jgi:hypothetical protein
MTPYEKFSDRPQLEAGFSLPGIGIGIENPLPRERESQKGISSRRLLARAALHSQQVAEPRP